jgi:hypothetical protein
VLRLASLEDPKPAKKVALNAIWRYRSAILEAFVEEFVKAVLILRLDDGEEEAGGFSVNSLALYLQEQACPDTCNDIGRDRGCVDPAFLIYSTVIEPKSNWPGKY